MNNTIIKVENLSKRYRIGTRQPGYKTFREAVIDSFTAPIRNFKRLRKLSHFDDTPPPDNKELITNNQKPTPDNRQQITDNSSQSDVIWALKDVSFEVKQGEVVGIIGRNGSGKSTLLKILSRITEPTSGEVKLHGLSSSLLEVGTGFHPELTGRENIYLNGAILGMRKTEIENKFDEIVDFAEIEKFIDTPVKRYSSGMYVRLAFAVASHLEPEILIVDEVLAVGDAQFQKKCLGKMEEVSIEEGKTILFVSHQMGAIAQFCNKALLLDRGQIIQLGTVPRVVNYYMNMSSNNMEGFKTKYSSCQKDITIMTARTYDSEGKPAVNFTHDQEIIIKIACKINNWVTGAELRVVVRDSKRNVFTTDTELLTQNGEEPNELRAEVLIPGGVLRPEQYFFKIATYLPNQVIFDTVEDALSIKVADGGSKYAASEGVDYGCVFVDCKWRIDICSSIN